MRKNNCKSENPKISTCHSSKVHRVAPQVPLSENPISPTTSSTSSHKSKSMRHKYSFSSSMSQGVIRYYSWAAQARTGDFGLRRVNTFCSTQALCRDYRPPAIIYFSSMLGWNHLITGPPGGPAKNHHHSRTRSSCYPWTFGR